MVLNRKKLSQCKIKEFQEILGCKKRSYDSLRGLRSFLNQASDEDVLQRPKKLRYVQNCMKNKLTDQQVQTRRRVPGTGTLVKVKKQYKDTADNRRKRRVGEYYFVDKYEDAEYEERAQVKFRRIKTKKKTDPDAPKKKTIWIEAVQLAKEELGVPRNTMVIVRKEVKNPDDEAQVLGTRVYKRAIEIKEGLKAERANAEVRASTEEETQRSSKRKAVAVEEMPQDDNAGIRIEHVVKKRRKKKQSSANDAGASVPTTIS